MMLMNTTTFDPSLEDMVCHYMHYHLGVLCSPFSKEAMRITCEREKVTCEPCKEVIQELIDYYKDLEEADKANSLE